MSRAPQWNAQLIQHYYSPFGTTQLEKTVKILNLGSFGAAQIDVFEFFLQLGGSKWTVIVLYELGVPLRRSGHPTCLYSDQNKIRLKIGSQKLRI